jgi:hypothetical protein
MEDEIAGARALQGVARVAAYRRLELDLVRRDVPLTVYGNAVAPEFFSERVGCRITQSAINLVDLGTLCLRG